MWLMKKMNISIFLNDRKSKHIFLRIKRYIKYCQLKYQLRKKANLIVFKNQYQILTSSNKKLCHYFCFNTNDLSIILGDEATVPQNRKLLCELKDITPNVYFLVFSSLCKTDVNLKEIFRKLGIATVGMNGIELLLNKEENENSLLKQEEIYPPLVEESIEEIEHLFEAEIEQKKKRFLALKILGKDFPLIEEILTRYEIDKYIYLKQKQELMEYGYDVERLFDLYFSFYECRSKEYLE